ncbi:MAG TPA: glycosyl hydrolase family 8 [Polyangia bacterium]|nr:glycosyl hydrolase family 8 [Polyangia bacterium]
MSRAFAALALLTGFSLGACAKAPDNGNPTGNGTGVGGTSGTGPVMNPPSSYPQNTAGAAFPYPQGHAGYCTFPTYDTDTVATAYTGWKAKFFDGTKIIRPENGNDTVSEGIGYGMLIAVFMNDQPLFESLWTYAQAHPDGKGLMTWCIPSGMANSCSGTGSATDGDEDIAYALLMATKQWGTHASDAMTQIKNILKNEVSGSILEGGDGFNNAAEIDPSYFAPSYYRAFAAFDTADGAAWMSVLDESYSILGMATGTDGLVPNWINPSGTGISSVDSTNGPYFGYDSCRIPFRVAMDFCINNEARAKNYAGTIATFYASKATATSLVGIMDGYTTTGGNPPGSLGDYAAGMAFLGPGAVAAMAAGNQDGLRDLGYTTLRADATQGAMKVSGTFTYFHASLGVLSLLALSGNFWDMTQ